MLGASKNHGMVNLCVAKGKTMGVKRKNYVSLHRNGMVADRGGFEPPTP